MADLDFRVLNYFIRLGYDEVAAMPRETARLYFAFQASELSARWKICNIAESLDQPEVAR